MADKSRILTGVKEINFYEWDNSTDTVSLEASNKYTLNSVIADSVAISQDDVESNQTDCETRDEPIIESITLGKYNIEMDSADINYDILEKCFGFTKVGTVAAAAPAAYIKKYGVIEIVFDTTKLVIPRALLGSKIDASSLKTGVAKGTLSGSGYSAKVKIGANEEITTPFVAMDADATYTVAAL